MPEHDSQIGFVDLNRPDSQDKSSLKSICVYLGLMLKDLPCFDNHSIKKDAAVLLERCQALVSETEHLCIIFNHLMISSTNQLSPITIKSEQLQQQQQKETKLQSDSFAPKKVLVDLDYNVAISELFTITLPTTLDELLNKMNLSKNVGNVQDTSGDYASSEQLPGEYSQYFIPQAQIITNLLQILQSSQHFRLEQFTAQLISWEMTSSCLITTIKRIQQHIQAEIRPLHDNITQNKHILQQDLSALRASLLQLQSIERRHAILAKHVQKTNHIVPLSSPSHIMSTNAASIASRGTQTTNLTNLGEQDIPENDDDTRPGTKAVIHPLKTTKLAVSMQFSGLPEQPQGETDSANKHSDDAQKQQQLTLTQATTTPRRTGKRFGFIPKQTKPLLSETSLVSDLDVHQAPCLDILTLLSDHIDGDSGNEQNAATTLPKSTLLLNNNPHLFSQPTLHTLPLHLIRTIASYLTISDIQQLRQTSLSYYQLFSNPCIAMTQLNVAKQNAWKSVDKKRQQQATVENLLEMGCHCDFFLAQEVLKPSLDANNNDNNDSPNIEGINSKPNTPNNDNSSNNMLGLGSFGDLFSSLTMLATNSQETTPTIQQQQQPSSINNNPHLDTNAATITASWVDIAFTACRQQLLSRINQGELNRDEIIDKIRATKPLVDLLVQQTDQLRVEYGKKRQVIEQLTAECQQCSEQKSTLITAMNEYDLGTDALRQTFAHSETTHNTTLRSIQQRIQVLSDLQDASGHYDDNIDENPRHRSASKRTTTAAANTQNITYSAEEQRIVTNLKHEKHHLVRQVKQIRQQQISIKQQSKELYNDIASKHLVINDLNILPPQHRAQFDGKNQQQQQHESDISCSIKLPTFDEFLQQRQDPNFIWDIKQFIVPNY